MQAEQNRSSQEERFFCGWNNRKETSEKTARRGSKSANEGACFAQVTDFALAADTVSKILHAMENFAVAGFAGGFTVSRKRSGFFAVGTTAKKLRKRPQDEEAKAQMRELACASDRFCTCR